MAILTFAYGLLSKVLILCTKDIVFWDHMLTPHTVHLLD